MIPFSVTILGCGSATPTSTRHPAAQVVNHNNRLFLVDCGEGTQMQLRQYKIKFQRIDHIFISHLHGDHFYGLIGLISTMNILGRKSPLHIHCPSPVEEIISIQQKFAQEFIAYPIQYHPLNFSTPQVIVETNFLDVSSIPLKHRVDCAGFLFKEKLFQKNIRTEVIEKLSLMVPDIIRIKNGENFVTKNGETIPNEELTVDLPLPRSYAYISDTQYDDSIAVNITNTNLLYHDSTFANDKKDRAAETYHCTSEQAAGIAKKAGVKKLLLGHFSARYDDLQPMLAEAKEVFTETAVAEEGITYPVE